MTTRRSIALTVGLTWLLCVPAAYYVFGPLHAVVAFAVPPALAAGRWLLDQHSSIPTNRQPDSE
ncbi:hypothetical protein AYO47_09245 [Planctomyces sp. SCGC AG-212-M04]|nr:hypothetical protein AYO47_09245 [Planctomyces sp. SCGC AG-212-M04]